MRITDKIFVATIFVCALAPRTASSQATFATAVADLKQGYFERTYSGKAFSDLGEVELYDRRAGWMWNGKPTPPYVQIFNFQKGVSKSWCVLSEQLFTKYQKDFPVGTKVRMNGKMNQWYLADETLLLDDNCVISSNDGAAAPFDLNVVIDMRSYFARTYQGKSFADTGVVSAYSDATVAGPATITIDSKDPMSGPPDTAWCPLDPVTYDRLRTNLPSQRKIRVSGTMSQWGHGFFSNVPSLGLTSCTISGQ